MWILGSLLVAVCIGAAFLLGYLVRASRYPAYMQDVVDFHEKFELGYDGPPRVLPTELANFRIGFMKEELDEYVMAEQQLADMVADSGQPMIRKLGHIDSLLELELDALIDLIYVALGTAYLQFGAKVFDEGWERVQHANMKKVRKLKAEAGHTDSGRAAQFDVVKPTGWEPPTHLDMIQTRHTHVLELTDKVN